jgi:hypothetical protein
MWHLYKFGKVAKTRKYSCELNCTSNGFCCNFLYLAINHGHRGLLYAIFDEHTHADYADIDMINMPQVYFSVYY